jgi:predicted TIM-barrel fold metal-dependent hydrolase
MRGSYKVIDADRHVIEPRDIWERYLEAPFRDRAPRWLGDSLATEVAGQSTFSGGADLLRALGPSERFAEARAAGFSPRSNIQDMDREGVDVAVLFPSAGLHVIWADHVPVDLAAAICRAYNDWLRDYCAHDRDRLKGLALLPVHDATEAAKELRRAREQGLAGGVVRPNPVRKRQLCNRDFWPLYAEAERLEMPLWIHGGPGCVLPEIGVKDITGAEHPEGVVRFEGAFTRAAISHPLELMGAMGSLAAEEPMMDFPGLRAVFAGGGCGWLHFWADRLDDDYFNRGEDAVTRLKPGHYIAHQASVVARADECMLPDLAGEFQDNLLWGSDYPRPELTCFPDELDALIQNKRLSERYKRKILWDNAARLLKLTTS